MADENNILNFIQASNNEEMLRFLFEKKLIQDFMKCENCYNLMLLKKTKDNDIKYNWRCLNYNCSKYQTTVSVFRNNFFGNFNISPRKSLQILFYLRKGLQRSKYRQ
ncbi:hypothetical protein DMUE_4079 [Dictyocoela muelleri]|nr:hypothetical protein DMUE_4079 [Dictyocoela muelleri]